MAAKDKYHDAVRNALLNSGWKITFEPLIIAVGNDRVYVDLGAERSLIAAQKDDKLIAVEVKSFETASDVYEFSRALGQYLFYRSLLRRRRPNFSLYLAVTDVAYNVVLRREIFQPALEDYAVSLLVVNPHSEEVVSWIK